MRIAFVFFLSIIIVSCKKPSGKPGTPVIPPVEPPVPYLFIRGLDLSFTPETKENTVAFRENGTIKDILQIAKDKGINAIRLRLWNNPVTQHSSLTEVADFAKQIKAAGLKFWLDFHYSDTWADPGAQSKPAAWNSVDIIALKDSIYNFTKNTLSYLAANNALPDYVETGNEINSGFLWNDGKVTSITDVNWANFIDLLKQGIKATRETNTSIKIIIHIAGYDYAQQFFDKLKSFNTDYDIIGLSYYPWWHGKDLSALQQTVKSIAINFQKPVLIAETAYPFTFQYNDYTNNIVGSSDQLISNYPSTIQGQAQYLSALISSIKSVADKDQFGVCYWAPDWVAFKGATATDGSPWENLTLFDFQNNALPGLDSLGKH